MNRFLPLLLALLVANLSASSAMADTNVPVVGVTNALSGTNIPGAEQIVFKGLITSRQHSDRGTLTFEAGTLVFSYPTVTNRYPLADKTHKTLPLPGFVLVNTSEIVLATREGDVNGVLVLHLRSSDGEEFVLKENQPLPVIRETRHMVMNGVTNTTYSWKKSVTTDFVTLEDIGEYTPPTPGSSENAVISALDWLKANQNENGSWGNTTNGIRAETALALLAFLGHGETTASADYGKTVIAGFRFLIVDMQTTNQVGDPSAIEHAIATWALCEGFNLMRIPVFKSSAEEALAVIVKGQRSSGLWDDYYRQTDGEDNIEASAWQFIALTSGMNMGSKADGLKESIERASRAMEKILESQPDSGTIAGAVLCLQLNGKSNLPICQAALATLDTLEPDWEKPAFKDPIFRWNLITQAVFQKGNPSWIRWSRLFPPMLVKNQKASRDKEGKVIGYWDSPGSGERFGRVYSTAMSVLMLEVYYRYLPSFSPVQQPDEEGVTNDIVIKF